MNRCEFCHQLTQHPCIVATTGCRLWKRYDEERSMNIRFMKRSDDWSRWPILPLKNRDMPFILGSKSWMAGIGAVGFLVAGKGPVVHRGSMFELSPGCRWDSFSREEYPDFESLFRAGWRVD